MNKLNNFLRNLLFIVPFSLSETTLVAAEKDTASPYAGEFILSRNQFHDPVCEKFTRNLNQFRKLPFTQCHPRLSEKFPEFSRPKWEEIPFDMGFAESIIRERLKKSPALVDDYLNIWRTGIEPFLRNGDARMWRILLDVDGDGRDESLIRIFPAPNGVQPPRMALNSPGNCAYNQGSLFLGEDASPKLSETFNVLYLGSDIIHYAGDNRHYIVRWNGSGPAYPHIDIGATAGVVLSQISWNGREGYTVTGGDVCLIDWVPTGKYRPLKRPSKQ